MTASALKVWWRSKSLTFARHSLDDTSATPHSACIQWNGYPLCYRAGTSDVHVLYSILFKPGKKAEYWIPRPIHPTTILDIGGNIGAAAIYFAGTYPQARVFSFEPMPANFDLLQRNTAPYKNIRVFNVALGLRDATLELVEAPNTRNLGGYSLYQRDATDQCKRLPVTCRAIEPYLNEIGAAAPDLIKIDTEGAEFEILTALSDKTLAGVKWIVGELHGERDFELLAYLSRWFEIGIKKSVSRPLCAFTGRNRQLVPYSKIRGGWSRW